MSDSGGYEETILFESVLFICCIDVIASAPESSVLAVVYLIAGYVKSAAISGWFFKDTGR